MFRCAIGYLQGGLLVLLLKTTCFARIRVVLRRNTGSSPLRWSIANRNMYEECGKHIII